MDFENKLNELQEICGQMEDENLPLGKGLELYEKGVTIAKECYQELNSVKGKVTIIKQDLEKFKEDLLD